MRTNTHPPCARPGDIADIVPLLHIGASVSGGGAAVHNSPTIINLHFHFSGVPKNEQPSTIARIIDYIRGQRSADSACQIDISNLERDVLRGIVRHTVNG